MMRRTQRNAGAVSGGAGWRLTVEEAVHTYVRLLEWLGTQSAIRALSDTGWRVSDEVLSPEERRRVVAERILPETRQAFAAVDPIYADAAMVDYLAAAADAMPDVPLRESDFLDRTGVLIFAVPLPAVVDNPDEPDLRIRAITWCIVEGGISVVTWRDRHGLYRVADQVVRFTGLCPATNSAVGWDSDTAQPREWKDINVLRALAALSRHPSVGLNRPALSAKASTALARTNGHDETTVRRVYLHRPEDGARELEAARDARAGRSPRGHWVRGHWRNQYYPSVDEHRLIWVEGHFRGDFSAGTVPGQRAIVAKAPVHE